MGRDLERNARTFLEDMAPSSATLDVRDGRKADTVLFGCLTVGHPAREIRPQSAYQILGELRGTRSLTPSAPSLELPVGRIVGVSAREVVS